MQEGITYLKCTCCNFHVESVQYTTSCTLISLKKIAWLLTQHILASYSLSHLAFIHFTTLMGSFPLPTHPTHTHTHIYPHTTPTPHSHPHSYPYMPTHTPSPLHTHTHTRYEASLHKPTFSGLCAPGPGILVLFPGGNALPFWVNEGLFRQYTCGSTTR